MGDAVAAKARILDAAKKLFAKKGFEGTATREIVRAAGVNISAISYYFGGKENLLFALFNHFMEFSHQNGPAASDAALIEEFTSILKRVIKLRFEEPELINILHHEIILNSARSGKIKASLTPVWERIRQLLDEGKKRGLFVFQNTETALTFTLSVAIFPRQIQYLPLLSAGQPADAEASAGELLDFVLKGLGFRTSDTAVPVKGKTV